MTLLYLDFDYSEDTEDTGVFDAMASVGPAQLAALHAEVAQVLGWAHAAFAGRRGAMEEGGEWDYDLQGLREVATPEHIAFDEGAGALQVHAGAPGVPRHTLTLSIGGSREFCAAFRARFGLD
ncbi:MAG: hypothetical protein J7549_08535 [Variovorax sp.]|nr:hypothetical protein [Variovorax sp.]